MISKYNKISKFFSSLKGGVGIIISFWSYSFLCFQDLIIFTAILSFLSFVLIQDFTHCWATLFSFCKFSKFFLFINYLGKPCRAQNDCQQVLQEKKSWRILISFYIYIYIYIFPVSFLAISSNHLCFNINAAKTSTKLFLTIHKLRHWLLFEIVKDL